VHIPETGKELPLERLMADHHIEITSCLADRRYPWPPFKEGIIAASRGEKWTKEQWNSLARDLPVQAGSAFCVCGARWRLSPGDDPETAFADWQDRHIIS
jgi:hypothetical protein